MTMPETTHFEGTWILDATLRDLRSGVEDIWHEGGSRSGKTHNIAAAVLMFAREEDISVDVVRMSQPAVRGSVLVEDLLPVMDALGYYDASLHNKTDGVIQLRGGRGRVRYYGCEDEQKVRGWSRGILWMNEANEIDDERRRQLWMRTTGTVILDHNPTVDDDHWIVQRLEKLVATGSCNYYHSTYLDNPFLPAMQVRRIEAMQWDDPYGWKVYGLGERGTNPAAVFEHVGFGDFDPSGDTVYGVDFGMRDPFVVVEVGYRDSNPPIVPRATVYIRPHVYATNMTTGQAIREMNALGLDKGKKMWCDAAEPDRIREICEAGYWAEAAQKKQGSRGAGYDWLKRHALVVDSSHANGEAVRAELRRTRHVKKSGTDVFTDKVADVDDHVADAVRYGAVSRFNQPQHWIVA